MIQIETGPTKYKHPFLSVAHWTYSQNIFTKTFLRLKRKKRIQSDIVVRLFMCFILSRLYPTLVINKLYQTVMIFLSHRITKIHSYKLLFLWRSIKVF